MTIKKERDETPDLFQVLRVLIVAHHSATWHTGSKLLVRAIVRVRVRFRNENRLSLGHIQGVVAEAESMQTSPRVEVLKL